MAIASPFIRFRNLLKIDQKDVYQVYAYALFNGLINLSLPLGLQAIVNLIQGGEINFAWMVLVSFVIMGVAFTGLMQFLQLRIVENIAQKIFARASFDFAYRIPQIKYGALDKYYAPELANRFFDTLTIQKGLPKILIDFSLSIFQILVGLILLSLYHPFFILYGIALLVIIYIIIIVTGPNGMKSSIKESSSKYQIAFWLEEIARVKLSFKLTNSINFRLDKCNTYVEDYLKKRESHFRLLANQFAYLIGFKVLITAGLLIIGSLLVFNQEMNIGQFVAAEIVIIILIASVEKLIKTLDTVYDVLTALEKIGYVGDLPLEKKEGLDFNDNFSSIGLEVKDISYQYPLSSEAALKNISFNLPAGQSLYIKGKANSGKSTLLKIIAGIKDPMQGIISYNNLSLLSVNKEQLRSNIGFVIGNREIFQASVLENITIGRENISMSDVQNALKLTCLDEYINKLPMGLSTILDPEGKKISKSSVDKILLARAIVTNPKLLLLDSPLYHVQEANQIITNICGNDMPWKIIVSSINEQWAKHINHYLLLDKGDIAKTNLA